MPIDINDTYASSISDERYQALLDHSEKLKQSIDYTHYLDDRGRVMYTILTVLGVGGMGRVYKAFDHSLLREVALKTVSTTSDPEVERALKFEAIRHAKVEHPNIVKIFRVFDEQDQYRVKKNVKGKEKVSENTQMVIVSELITGKDLSRVLKELHDTNKRLSDDPVAFKNILQQVAMGIDATHSAGIVHFDIKPGNVLISDAGVVKISDFGIALPLDPDTGVTQRTQDDLSAAGTPHYTSPEKIVRDDVKKSADLYSFGIVVFECLTGQRYFDLSGYHSVEAWNLRAYDTAPNRLNELRQQFGDVFGEKFEQCFQKCLALNPDDRHSSALEFVKEVFQIYDDYLLSKQIQPTSDRQ